MPQRAETKGRLRAAAPTKILIAEARKNGNVEDCRFEVERVVPNTHGAAWDKSLHLAHFKNVLSFRALRGILLVV